MGKHEQARDCSAHCGSNPRRNRCFQGDSNSLGSRNRRDPCWSLPLRSLQCVLGGLDRARSARRDHRGGCHPHLSSWISSCCSQRTSVRNGHRQLHCHLDGVLRRVVVVVVVVMVCVVGVVVVVVVAVVVVVVVVVVV